MPFFGAGSVTAVAPNGAKNDRDHYFSHTIHVMYGIFTYIWLKFMVNAGKYTIHGS